MTSMRSLDARLAAVLVAATCLLGAAPAAALVTTPVGGEAGQFDMNVGVTFERGEIEPNDNEESWQDARWDIYTAGVGYSFGDVGYLHRVFARIEYSWYDSPAEINDSLPVPEENCRGRYLGGGRCQFHPRDRGSLISPQAGFDIVHTRNYAFGVFFKMNIPLDVNFEKFAIPRTDFILLGTHVGVRLYDWMYYQSRLVAGTGPLNKDQNPTIAIINNFGFEAQRWLLPQKIGVMVGPYFDADFRDRFDDRYDAAFFSGVPATADQTVAGPGDTRDRIRMMRFGYSITPYVGLTDFLALEGNFTQKLFGYDTPATQFFYAGARAAF